MCGVAFTYNSNESIELSEAEGRLLLLKFGFSANMSSFNPNELKDEKGEPQKLEREEDAESVIGDIDGVLESSGGSLELAQLQQSTVTFAGVPSPQPSDSFPHKEPNSALPARPITANGFDEPGS